MSSKLDELLDSIDPRTTVFEIERRSQRTLADVNWPEETPGDPDEFLAFLTRVFRGGEKEMLHLAAEVTGRDGFYQQRCVSLLNDIYGPSGWRTAFDLSVSGVDGGLYGVVSKLLGQMAGTYAGNEIEARINAYWDSLSNEERLAAPDEYLSRHGDKLPEEMVEGSAAAVRAHFPEVLKLHARRAKDLNRVGRG